MTVLTPSVISTAFVEGYNPADIEGQIIEDGVMAGISKGCIVQPEVMPAFFMQVSISIQHKMTDIGWTPEAISEALLVYNTMMHGLVLRLMIEGVDNPKLFRAFAEAEARGVQMPSHDVITKNLDFELDLWDHDLLQ